MTVLQQLMLHCAVDLVWLLPPLTCCSQDALGVDAFMSSDEAFAADALFDAYRRQAAQPPFAVLAAGVVSGTLVCAGLQSALHLQAHVGRV